MNSRKYMSLLLVLVILICVSCRDRSQETDRERTINQGSEQRIDSTEIIYMTWPTYLVNMMGFTPEKQLEQFIESNIDEIYAQSVVLNEDGSITFEMYQEQKHNFEQMSQDNLRETIEKAAGSEIAVSYSEDYKELEFKLSRENLTSIMGYFQLITSYVASLQLLEGEDPDISEIRVSIVDSLSEKVVKEFMIPGEHVSIKEKDWDNIEE